jgi:hypothetical protein
MASLRQYGGSHVEAETGQPYAFDRNDSFDRTVPLPYSTPQLIESMTFMKSIRDLRTPAIPRPYDMMINNVGSPATLRVALDLIGSTAAFVQMKYYKPWIYEGD